MTTLFFPEISVFYLPSFDQFNYFPWILIKEKEKREFAALTASNVYVYGTPLLHRV